MVGLDAGIDDCDVDVQRIVDAVDFRSRVEVGIDAVDAWGQSLGAAGVEVVRRDDAIWLDGQDGGVGAEPTNLLIGKAASESPQGRLVHQPRLQAMLSRHRPGRA